jgi:hypothetical protein
MSRLFREIHSALGVADHDAAGEPPPTLSMLPDCDDCRESGEQTLILVRPRERAGIRC